MKKTVGNFNKVSLLQQTSQKLRSLSLDLQVSVVGKERIPPKWCFEHPKKPSYQEHIYIFSQTFFFNAADSPWLNKKQKSR